MSVKVVDRTRAISATTGTADFALTSTPGGFQSFAAALSDGDQVYYTAKAQLTGDWEVGIGTYSAGVLARTSILSSSTGVKVVFPSGGVDVFVCNPAQAVRNTTGASITVTGNMTAQVGGTYYVNGDYDLTLPTDALVGDRVKVTKLMTATPTVSSSGTQQIKTQSGSDTSVTFDINAELVFVFNGTDWEI